MFRLIASDLDGTLLYPKRQFTLVNGSNKRFIRYFYQLGGQFVIASGRGLPFCKKIGRSLKVPCHYIAYNGALVIANGEVIDESLISHDDLRAIDALIIESNLKLARTLMAKDLPIVAKTWKLSVGERLFTKLYAWSNGRYAEKISTDPQLYDDVLTKEEHHIYKFSLLFRTHLTEAVRPFYEKLVREFGDHLKIVMVKNSIEINALNVSKGIKLEILSKHLGIDKEEVAVVGDDHNDVSMFERFPHSFAMLSAVNEIQDKATHRVKRVAQIRKHL